MNMIEIILKCYTCIEINVFGHRPLTISNMFQNMYILYTCENVNIFGTVPKYIPTSYTKCQFTVNLFLPAFD